MINWDISKEDEVLVNKIIDRTKLEMSYVNVDWPSLRMDLTACHCNGNPLRLQDLLYAPGFEFAHDILGIVNNIDRTTGELKNFFVPRFSE